MTQMPLWGKPERESKTPPTDPTKIKFTKYSGKPTTCHLCTIATAKWNMKQERDLASYQAKSDEWVWLLCHSHHREAVKSPKMLYQYLIGE